MQHKHPVLNERLQAEVLAANLLLRKAKPLVTVGAYPCAKDGGPGETYEGQTRRIHNGNSYLSRLALPIAPGTPAHPF